MVEKILIGLILWIVGLFFGFLIRGAFFKSSEAELRLQRKHEELQREFAVYRRRVETQMTKTQEILKEIQKGCDAADEQLSLITQEVTRQMAAEESVAAPRDYPSQP